MPGERRPRFKVGGMLLLFIALPESSNKARGDSRTKRISATFLYASTVKLQNGKRILFRTKHTLIELLDFSPENVNRVRERSDMSCER